MKRFEELNAMAQEALGGLHAGQELKQRILAASKTQAKPRERGLFKPVPMMAMAAALVIFLAAGALLVPGALNPGATTDNTNDIFESLPAGEVTAKPFGARALLDVPPGSISLSSGSAPEYRSIWASASGGNFPMIGVNGKYYRMMKNPSRIPQDLLEGSIGQIMEYTQEPALADPNQVLSNTVNQGEAVYAVSDMGDALVAASVNGELRVFQRISFANNAIIGSESLSDTLGIGGKVVAMELTDVGTVNDEATASYLADILLNNATFTDPAGSQSSKRALLIQLSNGLVVQMFVKNDTLSACGSWSCPEFFEAFEAAAVN